jgi:hypothetical protein
MATIVFLIKICFNGDDQPNSVLKAIISKQKSNKREDLDAAVPK